MKNKWSLANILQDLASDTTNLRPPPLGRGKRGWFVLAWEPEIANEKKKKRKLLGSFGSMAPPPPPSPWKLLKVETKICAIWGILEANLKKSSTLKFMMNISFVPSICHHWRVVLKKKGKKVWLSIFSHRNYFFPAIFWLSFPRESLFPRQIPGSVAYSSYCLDHYSVRAQIPGSVAYSSYCLDHYSVRAESFPTVQTKWADSDTCNYNDRDLFSLLNFPAYHWIYEFQCNDTVIVSPFITQTFYYYYMQLQGWRN